LADVHLGGPFEETGVEVEDIPWVGFTSWWTTEKKGHLTVSDGLFGKIVEDDKGVLAIVTEEFSHGGTSVWGKELQWSGVRGGGGHNGGVLKGVGSFETLHELGDSGSFLSDGDVDAVKFLGFI